MHYYSERRIKGMKSGRVASAECDIIIRILKNEGEIGARDGITLSLSDDRFITISLFDDGVRAILDMLAESSPEGGIEWGF